jgi:hypothetical protein
MQNDKVMRSQRIAAREFNLKRQTFHSAKRVALSSFYTTQHEASPLLFAERKGGGGRRRKEKLTKGTAGRKILAFLSLSIAPSLILSLSSASEQPNEHI